MTEPHPRKHSSFGKWLKVQSLGIAPLLLWLGGSYVIDYFEMQPIAQWIWIGLIMFSWLIGGNYFYFRLRGGATKADYIKIGFGTALLCIAAVIIAKD